MEDDADSSSIDDGDYFAHNEYFKQQQQKEVNLATSCVQLVDSTLFP